MTSTGNPISAIDDVTPTAFEEANAQVGSITDVNGSDGTFGIRYTLADVAGTGIKLDYMYFPVHGTGDATADQGMSGTSTFEGNKDAHDITLTGSVPGVEGLSLGVGYAKAKYDGAAANENEREEGTAYVKYAYGPLTVGWQRGAVGLAGSNPYSYKNTYIGISYAVSDDLSLSYNTIDSSRSGDYSVAQDFDSISLSYSMGGMTFGIVDADCGNCSYSLGRKQDETSVSLSVAF
jgi:outer membrane protein OmpU